jgi:trehalose-6-phosphatase
MKVTERRLRHHALGRYVNTYTASLWGRRLVRELRLARERTAAHATLLPLDVAQLRSFYERSRRRLLVLEYDGALAPHASLPRLAQPSPTLVSALRALCSDTRNTVYVLSGRRRDDLDEWLNIPRLGLVAEAGYWVRRAPSPMTQKDSGTSLATSLLGHPSDTSLEVESPEKDDEDEVSGDWEPPRRAVDLTWRDEVAPILESFTRRTPGSALETTDARLRDSRVRKSARWREDGGRESGPIRLKIEKKPPMPCSPGDDARRPHAIDATRRPSHRCWYFRDADPDFGIQQAKNLQLHLEVVVEHRPVRVVMSSLKKSVVVQPDRVSPGRALRGAIPSFDAYDLILAVGDEVYSEEDVFELFEGSPHSFSVTVGRRLSRAAFFLDEEEVLPTLQTLAAVTNEAVGTPLSSAQTLPRTSSLDLGASRMMPESPPTLTASFRPVDFPSFEETSVEEKAVDAAAALVEDQSLNS